MSIEALIVIVQTVLVVVLIANLVVAVRGAKLQRKLLENDEKIFKVLRERGLWR